MRTFRTLEPTWRSALRHELRLVLCTLHGRMFSMLDSMKSAACSPPHTSPSNCSSWSKILHAGNWEDIRYANSPSPIETNKNPTGVQGQTCLIASFFKNLECSAAPKGGVPCKGLTWKSIHEILWNHGDVGWKFRLVCSAGWKYQLWKVFGAPPGSPLTISLQIP